MDEMWTVTYFAKDIEGNEFAIAVMSNQYRNEARRLIDDVILETSHGNRWGTKIIRVEAKVQER
jgi:hypothetical protein